MSKVMIFNVPIYGHVYPTLPLADELINMGEEVIYYGTQEFKDKIEQTGSLFREYGIPAHIDTRPPANPVRTADIILSLTAELLPRLLEDARRDQVDYIVHDSVCVWGRAVARKLGIPAVCLSVTFALNPDVVKEISKKGGAPGAQIALMILAHPSWALNVWSKARQLRRLHGLDIFVRKIVNIFMNRSELNLVFTSKELQLLADRFDASYRFVGAMMPTHENDDASFWEDVNMEGKTLIYIALGTMRSHRLDFYRACFDSFRDTEYFVLMTVGKTIDLSELGSPPSNFKIYNFVPQIEILKKATLFITHAGINSVSEGLFFGVPLLMFPQTMEHRMYARRVAEVGAGRIFNEREFGEIGQLARTVIETDSYRRAAERIGDSFKTAGGPRRAAREIEEFKHEFLN